MSRTMDRKQVGQDLLEIAKGCRANSERWFPELHDGNCPVPLFFFYAAGMTSEAGEALDVVKKGVRRAPYVPDLVKLKKEIADSLTYMLLLCEHLEINPIEALDEKQAECEERWG